MTWVTAALLCFLLWGISSYFGVKATKIHGENVSIAFQAAAYIIISAIASFAGRGDFKKITFASSICASLMALTSVLGLYFLFLAFRLAPPASESIAVVISGSYPLLNLLIVWLAGTRITSAQWLGVAAVTFGFALINSKSS